MFVLIFITLCEDSHLYFEAKKNINKEMMPKTNSFSLNFRKRKIC